jgi:hypothetical protein
MTAYVIKRKDGIPRGLFIDGVELKLVQDVTIQNVPEDLPKIVATMVVLPEDTFEYQDVGADQG